MKKAAIYGLMRQFEKDCSPDKNRERNDNANHSCYGGLKPASTHYKDRHSERSKESQ